MWGMATKERVIQLIDSLPDTPETDLQLDDIEHKLEPNGSGEDDLESAPTFEQRLRKLAETFASMDFPPREDAWL
jgi:hypothetical protein